MALGGGSFVTQNKVLPGAYVNFVSLSAANATLSDRGIATMPLELDWGVEGEIFTVTNVDFQKKSMAIFGYPYDHEKMRGLRDLFKNVQTLHAYRLNGGGSKATSGYGNAKFSGVRGNDIKIAVQKNVDDEMVIDVITYMGTTAVDKQSVYEAKELVDNDYVEFNKDSALEITAGTPLMGGTNGTTSNEAYQNYLDKIEGYSFNAMGVDTTDSTTADLFVNFTKRLRDEMGVKFQTVLYNKAADYEGVINLKSKATTSDWKESALVYWVTGACAGCKVNASNLNKVYDGEFTMDVSHTQAQLIDAIENGQFMFHKVGTEIRVLDDVNSLVSTSDVKGDIFKDNQTIRVIDQIANDTAVLFTEKYLGAVLNDTAGRISFWNDLVKMRQDMQSIRAIENFNEDDVVVEPGDTKKSVKVTDSIEVINTMAKLYMTTVVA